MKKKYYTIFYLDKERDIEVKLYKTGDDKLEYIIDTPNHKTDNLIKNLAKIFDVDLIKNNNDELIIKGIIPASINNNNEDIYIFRLGKYRVANIYNKNNIELNGRISAIMKTLMSQTKDYRFSLEKTMVKPYILKELKFRTDLHTHMNANLSPDVLISLGIKHQIRYPLYYIKKLGIKLNEKQEKEIYLRRRIVEKEYKDSKLQGKYLDRKINDNTFINFADLILHNLENAMENIEKIRRSLVILKDGQAVFTNLEKLYLYRYIFAKGVECTDRINILNEIDNIKRIPVKEIKEITLNMLKDKMNDSVFKNNNLREDKLLWIAREYRKQGIKYVEIADTTLTKPGDDAIDFLEEIHRVMPMIEKETGVQLRFLCAIRRIPLTIVKDAESNINYLRDSLSTIKAIGISPYVVGSDFVGEEVNDIRELQSVIKELVQYSNTTDNGFTIRIHAGENDSLPDNVYNSIKCIKESLEKGQKMPRVRIGHGLYTKDFSSREGKALIKDLKDTKAVVEFQLTSNVRLNNITKLSNHPIKKYLRNGIKCVQGTDGCGLYGIDTIDEQLALQNLLGLKEKDLKSMRKVEEEIITNNNIYFEEKKKRFKELLNGRNLKEVIQELESKYEQYYKNKRIEWRKTDKVITEEYLSSYIKKLPLNKTPIIIAGGSFNSRGMHTNIEEDGINILKRLIKEIDHKKAYFVIGHSISAYEEKVLELCKQYNKKIEIYAIVPKLITKEVKERILKSKLSGVAISIENEESGIYKSFNYELFERIKNIVIAFDGNSPVSNLVLEAKNGKAPSKIYVNEENENLLEKAESLKGYITPFNVKDNIEKTILEDNPEIRKQEK